MNIKDIKAIYLKNIQRLSDEIAAYPQDENLWEIKNAISNSGGNLCLHLIGNMNHFIGATLGNTGYVRNREAEFSTRFLSKQELLKMIEEVKFVVSKTLDQMDENDLQKQFPFDIFGVHSNEYYLIFFIAHFEYHLGQINYHRRLV
jgi:uncharacterized damage-inducible protein DinB